VNRSWLASRSRNSYTSDGGFDTVASTVTGFIPAILLSAVEL